MSPGPGGVPRLADDGQDRTVPADGGCRFGEDWVKKGAMPERDIPDRPDLPARFDAAAVRVACGLAALAHLDEAPSTMTSARALAADPSAALPALVVADRQTAGRGRRGAGWWQAPGSLAMSLVVEAPLPGVVTPLVSLACGVAVAETVRALEPQIEALVRWPNDVVAAGRKLAGILVETSTPGRVVVGLGVNTSGHAEQAPALLRPRVATIPDLVGRELERGVFIVGLVPRLLRLLVDAARDPQVVVGRYRPLCSLSGRSVTVHHHDGRRLTGPCLGIDADGALVVDTIAGPVHLISGSLTDPADVWRGAADGNGA